MDFEKARFNMVEQQIRPWEVLDQRVLDLLFKVKREDFVPAECRALAFVDTELPLPNGGKMLQPKLEARIVQDLSIRSTDRILEIGTGSGYLTALLASLGQHVYSVDLKPQAVEIAQANLARAGIKNVTVEAGNGARGVSTHAPYDVIVIGASLPALPDALLQQLSPSGRLFAVLGDAPVMEATLVTRAGDGFRREVLFETVVASLEQAIEPERFVF